MPAAAAVHPRGAAPAAAYTEEAAVADVSRIMACAVVAAASGGRPAMRRIAAFMMPPPTPNMSAARPASVEAGGG